MASHPGLVLHPQPGFPATNMMVPSYRNLFKGRQTSLPSPVAKPDIIRYQSPCLKPNPCEESRKSQSERFDYNLYVNVEFSAQRSMLIDVQATGPNAVLLGYGVVEQCTKRDKILQFLVSGTADAGIDGVNLSLLSDLMNLQLSAIDEPQQPLSPLIYLNSKFYIQKPLLDFVQDSVLNSKITVHPDGQITFMGTGIEMKDFLSVVAGSYL